MKKQQTAVVFKLLVLVFIAAFVAGNFANMLCIPRYVSNRAGVARAGHNQLKNCHQVNFIQLFDRSIFDNDPPGDGAFIPRTLDLSAWHNQSAVIAPPILSPQNHPLYSYQYAYLSLCTFRI